VSVVALERVPGIGRRLRWSHATREGKSKGGPCSSFRPRWPVLRCFVVPVRSFAGCRGSWSRIPFPGPSRRFALQRLSSNNPVHTSIQPPVRPFVRPYPRPKIKENKIEAPPQVANQLLSTIWHQRVLFELESVHSFTRAHKILPKETPPDSCHMRMIAKKS